MGGIWGNLPVLNMAGNGLGNWMAMWRERIFRHAQGPAARKGIKAMAYVVSLIKEIVKKRKLIWDLSKADFRKRFVGSYFGIVWMFVQPMVTVLIYFFIFQVGFKSVPPVPGAPYVLWLVPGIVPWFFFSEALNCVTGCLQEYNYLVKKVVFQVEALPVIKMSSCLMVHVFFLLIMVTLFLLYGWMPMASWVQVLYYSFAASALALGIGFLTSAVNVFFKDMAQIVSICLQFGMWLTPIMYHESMFEEKAPWAVPVLKLNPFYYISTGYRDSMLMGNGFWERPKMTLYFWGVTLAVGLIGLKVFKRLRPHFSDVL